MKRLILIGILLTFGAILSAQDLTLSQLNQKVLELEKRIKRLEKLLLQQGRKSINTGVPAGKAAWRRLRRGMNPAQVRRLLGEPRRVFVIGIQTHWVYSGGRVAFVNRQLFLWDEE